MNLATSETKDLSQVLQVPLKERFYLPETQDAIKMAVEQTNGLVYPLDDMGEKMMKSDATAINKFATELDKTAAAIYKSQTEEAGKNRDITKEQVKILKGNREQAIAQFEAAKAKRIQEVQQTLIGALIDAWETKGVNPEFRLGNLPEAKESMVTSTGNLNAESKRIIEQISSNDLAWQNEIQGRSMLVELECRRAGIDTPFSSEYIGRDFNNPNPDVFKTRLATLIQAEIDRMEAVKAKLIAEQEAREKAEQERAQQTPKPDPEPITTPETLRQSAKELRESAAHADKTEYARQDYQQAENLERKAKEMEAEARQPIGEPIENMPGKKTITINATFEVVVAEHISKEAIATYFKSQLNQKLTEALVNIHAS